MSQRLNVCALHSGGEELCASLVTLTKLQHLHMGGHGLAACGSEVLRAAVQHTASLEQLIVKFAISNSGVAHLAPSLRTNQVLACLQLSAAAIGDAGAAALALSLPHNVGLRELDLSRVSSSMPAVVSSGLHADPTAALKPTSHIASMS